MILAKDLTSQKCSVVVEFNRAGSIADNSDYWYCGDEAIGQLPEPLATRVCAYHKEMFKKAPEGYKC